MLPRLIHFIHGMVPPQGAGEFGLAEYLGLVTAQAHHPRHKLVLWYGHAPTGNPYWEAATRLAEAVRVAPPELVFGRPLHHPAHRADVLRLQVLMQHGGIYFDTDMLVLRPLDGLFIPAAGMGYQLHPHTGLPCGLGNAVILGRPRATFLQRWLESFEFFHSTGKDSAYDFYGVPMPLILARQYGGDITILPHTHFFRHSWDPAGLEAIFTQVVPMGDSHAQHLWASAAGPLMRDLTPERILWEDSTYNLAVRPHVAGLSAEWRQAFAAARPDPEA